MCVCACDDNYIICVYIIQIDHISPVGWVDTQLASWAPPSGQVIRMYRIPARPAPGFSCASWCFGSTHSSIACRGKRSLGQKSAEPGSVASNKDNLLLRTARTRPIVHLASRLKNAAWLPAVHWAFHYCTTSRVID